MSSLTIRAERALIGALLDDTHADLDLSYLRAEDFGHRAYRRIYQTIRDLRASEPDLHGDLLVAAVAARAESPGIDAYFLRELRDTCPNAEHVAAYAAMVQAAAFRRELAEHQPANELLAAALQRQATIFAPLTADDTEPANGASLATAAGQRETQEDQILADLLRHPEQAHDLATFLPSETFTSPQRKELYETIVMLAEAGDAIDEIIVAWEHTRLHAYQRLIGADDRPPAPEPTEPDDVYLARLATTPITVPSAIEAARNLLAEDIRTTLSGNGNGRGVTRPTTTQTTVQLPPPMPHNGTTPRIKP